MKLSTPVTFLAIAGAAMAAPKNVVQPSHLHGSSPAPTVAPTPTFNLGVAIDRDEAPKTYWLEGLGDLRYRPSPTANAVEHGDKMFWPGYLTAPMLHPEPTGNAVKPDEVDQDKDNKLQIDEVVADKKEEMREKLDAKKEELREKLAAKKEENREKVAARLSKLRNTEVPRPTEDAAAHP